MITMEKTFSAFVLAALSCGVGCDGGRGGAVDRLMSSMGFCGAHFGAKFNSFFVCGPANFVVEFVVLLIAFS